MKVREIQSSSTFAWSPLASKGGLLACGSVAGALGDNFDAEATLDIYSLALEQEGNDMPKLGSIRTHDRFNRITWGLLNSPAEMDYQLQDVFPCGLIAGGLVDGTVQIWDARAIIDKSSGMPAEIATIDNHKGQVKGVEFNPFNQPLLATAAQDGEWCVWNLTNPSQPQNLATGVRGPHSSEIVQISWNKKVSHILAWTSSDGMTAVWDLKSKRQAMSFQDSQNRLRCSSIAWSPDKATDICVANDDDFNPVIQFWDLRKAYSPVRVLTGHRQGVLSLSWSPMDSNLLVSCGKDCRTLCWNPNTSEVLCELPVANNWVFDVQWSLKIPAILATGAFGENIAVYSLQDSSPTELAAEPSSDFSVASQTPVASIIKTAPKWLRRPAGASFGFGGRLVSFGQPPETSKEFKFVLRTVVTEEGVVERSAKFENILQADNLSSYCQEKVQQTVGCEQETWSILKTLLGEAPRKKLLEYLGFDAMQIQEEIEARLNPVVEDPFSEDAEDQAESLTVIPPEVLEHLIQRAITVGNFEAAVKCCLHADRMDDALVLASYGGPALWKRTQDAYFQKKAGKPFMKVVASIVDNQLANIVADFDASKDTEWKDVVAVLCTYSKPEDLSQLAGSVAEKLASKGNPDAILAYLAAGNLDQAVDTWVQQLDSMDANKSLAGLQDFIEKVSAFQHIVDKKIVTDKMAVKYTEYAELLSSQGCLDGAKRYLELLKPDCSQKSAALRDRVYRCQVGAGIPPFPPPPFPFTRVDIQVPPQEEPPATPLPAVVPPATAVPVMPAPVAVPTPSPVPQASPAVEPQMQAAPEAFQPQPAQPMVQPYGQPQTAAQPQFPQVAPQQVPQFAPQPAMPQQMQPASFQPQPLQPQQPINPAYPPVPNVPQAQQPMVQPQAPSQAPMSQHQQYQFPQAQQQTYPAFGQTAPQAPQQFGQPGWAQSGLVPAQVPSATPGMGMAQPPAPAATQPPGQMYTPQVPEPSPAPAIATPPSSGFTPAASGGAQPPASIVGGVNVAAIPAQWQPLANNLNATFSRLGVVNAADQKKRPAVEKALGSLYGKLMTNEVSPDVAALLLRFSQICEFDSHEAKEIVRKLTDAHWDQFKLFKDIKFLCK